VGDDDIKHAPAEPTTSDKPPSGHEHHEVRLDTGCNRSDRG